jgi:outer membrane protein assembly factor BamB
LTTISNEKLSLRRKVCGFAWILCTLAICFLFGPGCRYSHRKVSTIQDSPPTTETNTSSQLDGHSRRFVYLLEQIVDLRERRNAWSVSGRIRAITQDDDSLFVLTVEREIVARRLRSGENIWKRKTWPASDSIFEAGPYVYVLGTDGRIDRFKKADGVAQNSWMVVPYFEEQKGFQLSPKGVFAVLYATHLQIFDGTTPDGYKVPFLGKPRTGPDFDQVVATVEGRANGWEESETPPSLHALGEGFLLERELTTGTQLKRISADGDIMWERLIPINGNNPLRIDFLDENLIGLHGTHFEPATVVLSSGSGKDVAQLMVHSEEALLEQRTLLAVEDGALVMRDMSGSVRWQMRDVAPEWDPNHRLSSIIVDNNLVVAWYHSLGSNMRLMAIDNADGTLKWSKDVIVSVDNRKPFYHNLVTLESSSQQLIVTFDQSSGLTVLIFDLSGNEWWRKTKEWQDPIP